MLDLRRLPFTDSAKDKIRTTVNNYYRLAGIEVTGGSITGQDGTIILNVEVSQRQPMNNKILSESELISRGATIFDGLLPDGCKVNISAVPYVK